MRRRSIGYFSPEFGIAAALPQYSGGLGILAGDHLKSASDLGVPIIARRPVLPRRLLPPGDLARGLAAGELPGARPRRPPAHACCGIPTAPPRRSCSRCPTAARSTRGCGRSRSAASSCCCSTPTSPRTRMRCAASPTASTAAAASTGCCRSCCSASAACARSSSTAELTGAPYPEVFHTNEGHAGFLGLERISDLIGDGLSFQEALQVIRAGTVFTTHTPVPAGIDRFEVETIERYLSTDLLPGVHIEDVLALGTEEYEGGDPDEVQHGRDGPAPRAARERRLEAARRGVARHVRRAVAGLRPGRRADHIGHQRRARADLGRPDARRPRRRRRSAPGTPPTVDWTSDKVKDADLWRVRRAMREQLVADARRRAHRGVAGAEPRARRAVVVPRDPRPRHPHDRVRAPRADLQAAHAHAARPRAAARAAAAPGAAGAGRGRRQVASGRRRGQAAHPGARRVRVGAGGARAHRVPAQLRHRHGASGCTRAPTCGSTTRCARSRRAARRA